MSEPLARRLVAEGLGTALLLATIVGSGIMASRLAGDIAGLALLGNALSTGAMLVVLILIFGPVSGAHFNPVVSLAFSACRRLKWTDCLAYILVQLAGAVLGVWAAHLMFDLPLLQVSSTVRDSEGQWLAETVATFGLLLTIFGCSAQSPASVPLAVGLYISAAYWFTASTSFANPAVTVARSLSDTFVGIAPGSVTAFVVAQFAGAMAATVAARLLWPTVNRIGAAAGTALRP